MLRDGRKLPHDLLEEMRFRAIEWHQSGKSVSEIANLLGLHWGSVSRWLTRFAAPRAPGPERPQGDRPAA